MRKNTSVEAQNATLKAVLLQGDDTRLGATPEKKSVILKSKTLQNSIN
jgi:hypothetical protein